MKRNESRTRIEEIDGNYAQVRYYRYTGRAFEPVVYSMFWIELGASL